MRLVQEPIVGTFQDQIAPILSTLEAKRPTYYPLLVFIDPFGVKGYSMQTIRRILGLQSTEVFILVDVDGMARLLAAWNEPGNRQILTEALGVRESDLEPLRQLPDQRKKIEALRVKLLASLKDNQVAKGILPFRMYDANDSPLYDLIFLTNNDRGFEKMKESMWKADESGSFRFSDADFPGQGQLPNLQETPNQRLWKRLIEEFGGRKVRGSEINEFVNQTIFLNKHKTAALSNHEADQVPADEKIVVTDRKPKGPKKYPDYIFVSFPARRP